VDHRETGNRYSKRSTSHILRREENNLSEKKYERGSYRRQEKGRGEAERGTYNWCSPIRDRHFNVLKDVKETLEVARIGTTKKRKRNAWSFFQCPWRRGGYKRLRTRLCKKKLAERIRRVWKEAGKKKQRGGRARHMVRVSPSCTPLLSEGGADRIYLT